MKTLQQIKDHFKNAKEVRCLYDGKVYDITKNVTRYIHMYDFSYWIDIDNNSVLLYVFETNQLAKIVSFKEVDNKFKNGFKLPYDKRPFELSEVMDYFRLRSDGLDTIQIAYKLGISTGSLCYFRFNGLELFDTSESFSYDEVKNIINKL